MNYGVLYKQTFRSEYCNAVNSFNVYTLRLNTLLRETQFCIMLAFSGDDSLFSSWKLRFTLCMNKSKGVVKSLDCISGSLMD